MIRIVGLYFHGKTVKMKNKKRAVVIISGGLDSSTLLHNLIKRENYKPEELLSISFFYGQRHSKELDCAIYQSNELDVEHRIIRLDGFMYDFNSSLTGKSEIPNIKDVLGNPQPSTYVPYRNQLFLTIACGIAESIGAPEVYYGAQLHDLYGYWDCTEEFIEQFNRLISLNRKNKTILKAPFSHYTKSQTVQLAFDLNINLTQTWSCYKGNIKACGKCPTCAERIKAFKEINKEDGVVYE